MTGEQDTHSFPTQPLSRENQVTWDGDTGEEEIITPLPQVYAPVAMDATPTRPAGGRRPGLLGVLTGLALVLSIASLALSLLVIYSLSNVQRAAVQGLDEAISALDNLQGEGFQYDYRFEKTIPVSSSIPIHEEMVIPFSGDFPINTVVQVPIKAGMLGTFVIDVPINTSVQVDTEVPIVVDQTFEISTSIPVSMVIPIDIQPDDPGVQAGLMNLRAWLADLRESLAGGLRLPIPSD
jgi:hypothetical protein